MNTKKIWLFSAILGVIISGLIYMNFFSDQPDMETTSKVPNETASSDAVDKPKETETETENTESNEEEPQGKLNISEGMRAISVPVDHLTGVSGYIHPDDRVDLIIIAPQTQVDPESSHILFQHVRVVATGNRATNSDETRAMSYDTVTVELKPNDANILAFALEKSKIVLTLRGKGDETVAPHQHATLGVLGKGVMPHEH